MAAQGLSYHLSKAYLLPARTGQLRIHCGHTPHMWLGSAQLLAHAVNTICRLQEEQAGRIDNELAVVLSSIAVACKQIASMVNRAGISNLTGAAGEQNFSGEDQKKLDVVSNEVFSNCLRASGRTVSPIKQFHSAQPMKCYHGLPRSCLV